MCRFFGAVFFHLPGTAAADAPDALPAEGCLNCVAHAVICVASPAGAGDADAEEDDWVWQVGSLIA